MKEKIISLLKNNKECFISGQKISENLGVSRAAIWKYINAIKEDGYKIESVSRKGYKLVSSPDILTFEEVKNYINGKYIGKELVHLDSVDSTNNEAKKYAIKNAKEGTVIISEEQTMGRGRLGRNWVSPKYKGIWMSIILRPDIEPMKISKITQVAAASVTLAMESLGINAFIKWPNDIIMNGKKVCGILTEMSGELNKVNYVIVGIGVNANIEKDEFSDEIKEVASSLKVESHKSVDRKKLVGVILTKFEKLYNEFINEGNINNSIKVCKEKSILLGKNVRVLRRNEERKAKALDLNSEGRLIVQYENGQLEEIVSGEISIRGLNGYV